MEGRRRLDEPYVGINRRCDPFLQSFNLERPNPRDRWGDPLLSFLGLP
jgi:hypothetical protein